MRIQHLLLVAVLALIVGDTSAPAQPRGPDRQPRGIRSAQVDATPTASLNAKRDKLRQRIRALRAWRLTEALQLDEPTAAKLFPILARYDAKLEAEMKEGARLRRALRAMVKSGAPNPAAANALVDRMVKHQRQLSDLENRRFSEVRAALTPVQAAQILIVLPQIDRAIHREISQVMRKARTGARSKAGKAGKRGAVKNPFEDTAGQTEPDRDQPPRKRRGPPSDLVNPF
ncbi:MAG TPA: hypothetical protein VML75_12000 [Kofleriaceae bacterium]|nr:hypothetical protein [Kofleriaceae bacterium]